MRFLVCSMIVGLAAPAHAAAWTCQTALKVQIDGSTASDYTLSVTLNPKGAFQAEGTQRDGYFNYPIVWSGQYTTIDSQIAMIGPFTSGGWYQPFEARAFSTHLEPDVMILTLAGLPLATGPLRCLRQDER